METVMKSSDDENLVVFDDIQESYAPCDDIEVNYHVTKNNFHPSSCDWIGLYLGNWVSAKDYIACKWTTKKSKKKSNLSLKKKVIFLADVTQLTSSQSHSYQFLYITKRKKVVGKSKPFRILDAAPCITHQMALQIDVRGTESPSGELATFTSSPCDPSLPNVPSIPLEQDWSPHNLVKLWTGRYPAKTPPPMVNDHVTLMAPLKWKHNIPRLLMDPQVLSYYGNNEKALVPLSHDTALVPYHKLPVFVARPVNQEIITNTIKGVVSSKTPIVLPWVMKKQEVIPKAPPPPPLPTTCLDHSLHLGKRPRYNPILSPTIHGESKAWKNAVNKKLQCHKAVCTSTNAELSEAVNWRTVAKAAWEESAKVKSKLTKAEVDIELKTVVMDKLASQVKNLVQDSCNLKILNEELNQDMRVKKLREELTIMTSRASWSTHKVVTAQAEIRRLQNELGSVELMYKMNEAELQVTKANLSHKEADYTTLMSKYNEIEKLNRNIIFTLKNQGYATLKDSEGNDINMNTSGGSMLEMKQEHSAPIVPFGSHLAALAAKESILWHTRKENQQLAKTVIDMEEDLKAVLDKLQESEDETDMLRKELDWTTSHLTSVQESEQCLSRLAVKERKRRLKEVKVLEEKILQLESVVHPIRKDSKESQTTVMEKWQTLGKVGKDVKTLSTTQTSKVKLSPSESTSGRSVHKKLECSQKVKSGRRHKEERESCNEEQELLEMTSSKDVESCFAIGSHYDKPSKRNLNDVLSATSDIRQQFGSDTELPQESRLLSDVPSAVINIKELFSSESDSKLNDVSSAVADFDYLFSPLPSRTTSADSSTYNNPPSSTNSRLSAISQLFRSRSDIRRDLSSGLLRDTSSALEDIHSLYPSSTRCSNVKHFPSLNNLAMHNQGHTLSPEELSHSLSQLDSEMEKLLHKVSSVASDIASLRGSQLQLPMYGPQTKEEWAASKRSSHHLLRDVPSALEDISTLFSSLDKKNGSSSNNVQPCDILERFKAQERRHIELFHEHEPIPKLISPRNQSPAMRSGFHGTLGNKYCTTFDKPNGKFSHCYQGKSRENIDRECNCKYTRHLLCAQHRKGFSPSSLMDDYKPTLKERSGRNSSSSKSTEQNNLKIKGQKCKKPKCNRRGLSNGGYTPWLYL